jgi:hypothetical protein
VIDGGRTLFDGGEGTVWGEKGFEQSTLCPPRYMKEYLKSGWRMSTGSYVIAGIILGTALLVLFVLWRGKKSRKK